MQLCSGLNILWFKLASFFGVVLIGIGMKTGLFSSPVATAEFFKFTGILSAALNMLCLLIKGNSSQGLIYCPVFLRESQEGDGEKQVMALSGHRIFMSSLGIFYIVGNIISWHGGHNYNNFPI